jgi:hypothetical protein
MAVPMLALMIILAGPVVPAAAAGAWISPANGAYLTSDTVTVNAQVPAFGYGGWGGGGWGGGGGGGVLVVDGVQRAYGRDMSYMIDGHQIPNGRHYAIATSGYQGPWTVQSTFEMAVPAYPPAGVHVTVSGTTVNVGWNRGGEPDLTGYSVSSRYTTLWVSAACTGGWCGTNFKVPADANGDLQVSVVANRAGSGPSGPSFGSVRLVAAPKPKPKPKPHKSPTKAAPVQDPSPSKSPKTKTKAKAKATAQPFDTAPQPSAEPSFLTVTPPAEVVTPVASLHDEGNATKNRLMIAWAFVIVFVIVVVSTHFGASVRLHQRRRAALTGSGPKSRHRRQALAPGHEPEIAVLERKETAWLALPLGRTNESLNSPGHPVDSDADFPPPWT